jgi:hypothetical protein
LVPPDRKFVLLARHLFRFSLDSTRQSHVQLSAILTAAMADRPVAGADRVRPREFKILG